VERGGGGGLGGRGAAFCRHRHAAAVTGELVRKTSTLARWLGVMSAFRRTLAQSRDEWIETVLPAQEAVMERRLKFRVRHAAGVLVLALMSVPLLAQSPANAKAQPTFTRDIVPILQRSCQDCHRTGSVAPMSLLTYEEVRPWARSIKARVSAREMPPWFIDRHIGIRKFKNDISLSDAEIATVSGWVDAGAPRGNPADMPAPRQFSELTAWQTGKPDLVVEMRGERLVKAASPDWWGNVESEVAVTEDRWLKSVEVKPIAGYRMVHHAVASIVDPDLEEDEQNFNFSDRGALSEYSIGKNGDTYPEGTGVLLKAGSKIRWNLHLHSVGEEGKVKVAVAFQFYPKGYVPKYQMRAELLGGDTEQQIDLPANSDNIRDDTFIGLDKPSVITAFEAHMHNRGKAQCMEAIYPPAFTKNSRAGGVKTEMLSCVDRFNFGWLRSYTYADDVQPILPAGTILHVISWHNNSSSNKLNYDPTNWIGFGNRTIDDMSHIWLAYYNISEEEYKQRIAEREAKQRKTTDQN
jgi:hypothetical protein